MLTARARRARAAAAAAAARAGAAAAAAGTKATSCCGVVLLEKASRRPAGTRDRWIENYVRNYTCACNGLRT
jgi:hypothetical protein